MTTLDNKKITEFSMEDLVICWTSHKEYLLQILNGEYAVEDAKDDLRSLVGSVYDSRIEVKE